jgi:glycosyltransferase involved in cell wall biosynthesis
VLFVGRLDTAKGIEELLEAFASLASRRPNLRLAFVGDGPGGAHLRNKAKHLALEDRITLNGPGSSQDVARWLAAANVLALPSYNEGYPNVIIEALSCGRPVIATNVGGILELVNEDSGILISPRDSRALASAMDNAMDRKWDEHSIAEQFRRGWDEAANELLRTCEMALQQRSQKRQLPAKVAAVLSR